MSQEAPPAGHRGRWLLAPVGADDVDDLGLLYADPDLLARRRQIRVTAAIPMVMGRR
jgi:hypothetical protein